MSTVVARRRTTRLTLIAAGVVALLAVPVVAVAANRGGEPAATAGSTPTPTPTTAAPTPPAPSRTASPTPAAPGPEARLSIEDFARAKVDLTHRTGDWGTCPLRGVTFRNGRAAGQKSDQLRGSGVPVAAIRKLVHVDVDRDGRVETVALIACSVPDAPKSGASHEVTVFDRAPDGTVQTLATIVKPPGSSGTDSLVDAALLDIRAVPGGLVSVQFADFDPCCVPAALPQKHWRTYRFFSAAAAEPFTQTDGPTDFGPNKYVTGLSVKAAVVPGATSGSRRQATVNATVTNAGPSTAGWAYVSFVAGNAVTRGGAKGLSNCVGGTTAENPNKWVYQCRLGALAAGKSVTVSLNTSFRSPDQVEVFVAQRLKGHYDPDLLPEPDHPGASFATLPTSDNFDTARLG